MDFKTGNKYIQPPGADIRPTEKVKAPCGEAAGSAGSSVRKQRRRYIPMAMAAAQAADRKRPRVMLFAEKGAAFFCYWNPTVLTVGGCQIIDMATASTSALSDCVPKGRIRKEEEHWLPEELETAVLEEK